MTPRVWLITGSSTGFGRTMTEHVLKSGDIAVATLRKPEVLDELKKQWPADKLLVVKLDVTKTQDIVDAFNQAKDTFGRVDVVFNNAGFGVLGEVEGTPEEEGRRMFDTNFWGATNVSREAVRFFREVNKPVGGRLLIVSSLVGIKPMALIGYYTASKFALEGVSETLATELDPEWNIKVSLIEPGGYNTNGRNNGYEASPHPAYGKPSLPSAVVRGFLANSSYVLPGDVDKGVARIYELAGLENPPLRLPLGKDSLEGVRAQLSSVSAEVEKYHTWSDGLALDQVDAGAWARNIHQ